MPDIDIREFVPRMDRKITFLTGNTYAARWIDDLREEEFSQIVADEHEAKDLTSTLAMFRRHIKLLAPEVPDEELAPLTVRQLSNLTAALKQLEPEAAGPLAAAAP